MKVYNILLSQWNYVVEVSIVSESVMTVNDDIYISMHIDIIPNPIEIVSIQYYILHHRVYYNPIRTA